MSVKDMASLATTGMALSMLSDTFPRKKKKKKLVKTGINIIIGSSLIKSTAASVASI